MSIAWTTLLIIALLLPGVFFFTGYATRERYTREIVKSSAIGEVGAAVAIAIAIHLLSWGFLTLCGFDLAFYIKPLANFQNVQPWLLVDYIVARIAPVALYILGTAILGFLLGCLLAWGLMSGKLHFLATHKWIYQVMRSMRVGLVTAYVMTTTKEAGRVLMYKGVLAEFYLSPDGNFVYVVLKTCSRFFMKLDGDSPTTGGQKELFGVQQAQRPEQTWDYLLIDGSNIANILFDPSPQIRPSNEGTQELAAEIAAFEEWVRQHIPPDHPVGGPPNIDESPPN